jgi:mycothiol synthase
MSDRLLRPAVREDAEAIAHVCNVISRELYGQGDVDAESVTGWFGLPDIAMFVAVADGVVTGYADVHSEAGGDRFPIDLRVLPGPAGDGLAELLLDAVEEWARPRAAPGARVRAFVAERDVRAAQALDLRGYRLIRHAFTMEIVLPDEPEPVGWPPGLVVRTYDPARDGEAVYACAQEAFADHWDFRPVSLETFRMFTSADTRFDPGLWWLVEDGEELAAVSLNHWHFSGDPTLGWIGTLGVRRPWRRQGLGLALLRHSFADFRARGATRVGLGVDAENTTGAVRLYERAGMHPVRRNDTYDRAVGG